MTAATVNIIYVTLFECPYSSAIPSDIIAWIHFWLCNLATVLRAYVLLKSSYSDNNTVPNTVHVTLLTISTQWCLVFLTPTAIPASSDLWLCNLATSLRAFVLSKSMTAYSWGHTVPQITSFSKVFLLEIFKFVNISPVTECGGESGDSLRFRSSCA